MATLLRYSPYQPEWKEEYERLRDHLYHHLQPFILDIVHVGSTSVEGLGAKPILDVNVIYEKHFTTIQSILESLGYHYEGEKGIPNRHAFRTEAQTFYEHHLYVSLVGSDNLVQQLRFKLALQTFPKYRTEYMELKQQLIERDRRDRERYTNQKTPFIKRVLQEVTDMKSIIFAGGCFWGVEAYFKQLDGVTDTEVGYIGGNGPATYEAVCAGSGHAEAVLIVYDEATISLNKLLDHLFNIIDPTSLNRQGPDRGIQYRTGIYNYAPEKEEFIQNYLSVRQKEYKKPLQLEVKTNLTFHPAEGYHQDYLDKNPRGYCHVDLTSHVNVD